MSDKVKQELIAAGVVPIVRVSSAEAGAKVIEALLAGDVPCLEITMTVPRAIKLIEEVVAKVGDKVIVGAGTVLDPETARAVILAGVKFVVSPALNLKTVELCKRYNIMICPGALTPTEVVTAWEAGADMVKIFPCDNVGGPKYIKALKGPLPQIDMIPTGGVDLTTAADFIKAGACALAVGSALVNDKRVKAGDFAGITADARKFVEIVRQTRQEM